MLTIFLIVFGLSLLVLVHEAGHFFAAKAFGMKVEEFGVGFPPRAWGKKIGETVYSVNWLPLGGFVRLMGEVETTGSPDALRGRDSDLVFDERRSFRWQKAWKRAIVMAAGVVMNFILGWFLVSALFLVGLPKAIVITSVLPGSPAEAAGVLSGDQVLGFETVDEFIAAVEEKQGREFMLAVARGGETETYAVVPRIEPGREGRLGIHLVEAGFPSSGFLSSLGQGFVQSLLIVQAIALAIASLLVGIVTGSADFSGIAGPVGIVVAAADVGELGALYLVQLLALISLNLAVLNILPFPALDGGGLAFLALEKLRGLPLSMRTERLVTSLGFLTLLALIAALTVRDILSL